MTEQVIFFAAYSVYFLLIFVARPHKSKANRLKPVLLDSYCAGGLVVIGTD
jgi:hypothetical protein